MTRTEDREGDATGRESPTCCYSYFSAFFSSPSSLFEDRLPHFLHSFLHFFSFSPPLSTSHILLSSACRGEKRRLHSNYPAGSAHGDCWGCIKLITNQRQRDSEYALSADCVFIYTNLSVLHAGLLAIYWAGRWCSDTLEFRSSCDIISWQLGRQRLTGYQ